MKYLKYLLYFVGVLVVLFLLLCLAGPKTLDTSESISIEAPPAVVYNYLNDLKKGEVWNPWVSTDTSIVNTYSESTVGLNAQNSWTSEKLGAGSQKIVEVVENQLIKTELSFEGMEGINTASFLITPDGNNTHLVWDYVSGKPFCFFVRGIALLSGMKKGMSKNYKEGISNIKKITEERSKQNIYNGYTIKENILNERYFIINRQVVKLENVQQFYATNLGALFIKAQKAGVQMAGMPCGLFFSWDTVNSTTDMAAAIPIAHQISIEGALSFTIEAKKAIELDFYGDYHNIARAHITIDEYMKDKGYLQDVPVIEEYLTDPSTEPDTNKWLTKVSYYFTENN